MYIYSMRHLMHGSSSDDLGQTQYCGYKVYRGHTQRGVLPLSTSDNADMTDSNAIAYQTWGPGKRFAVVPTWDGFAWFAAITCSQHMSPLSLEQLALQFAGWHSPLQALVLHTEGGSAGVLVEDARASAASMPGWEAILMTEGGQPEYVNSDPHSQTSESTAMRNDLKCAEECKESSQQDTRSQDVKQRSLADIMQAAYTSNNVAPLMIYVGDAAGALDPTLAQGAGLGIESGYNLAKTIAEARNMHDRTLSTSSPVGLPEGGDGNTVMNIDNMKLHLLDFETARQRRFRRLQSLAALSVRVSHVESEMGCGIRNLCMGAVPEVFKKSYLDYVIRKSVL